MDAIIAWAEGLRASCHGTIPTSYQSRDRTLPPFAMIARDGKLSRCGTVDMKGFIARAASAAIKASRMRLATPLHLAFSYDEEIGCVGVSRLLEILREGMPSP